MAVGDLTVNTAQVGPVFTKFGKAEIYDFIASEAITIGDAVGIVAATGLIAPADANGAAALQQFKGIALSAAAADQAVSVLVHGMIYGYDLSDASILYGNKIYTSVTPGLISDTDVGTTCEIGEVWPLSDADLTKVLFVDVNIGDEAHS